MFRGIFTPLITPVTNGGSPDLASLRRLVDFQIAGGVHGLWAMGTSAEFASFTADERSAAMQATVEAAAGRVPVIANISDAGTRLAIEHGRRARAAGAAAVAATPPYYYPHSQDELLAHYTAIRDAIDLPLFIYNIPQTVRVRLELGTARTLVADGVVRGIKDSQNDLEWFRQLALFVRERHVEFALFAGTRHLIDAAVLAGADGAIPSVANIAPDLCVRVYQAAAGGEYQRAADIETAIIAIEAVNSGIQGGSRNAAVLGVLKAVLQRRGIIASAALTAPLRPLPSAEVDLLVELIETIRGNSRALTAS